MIGLGAAVILIIVIVIIIVVKESPNEKLVYVFEIVRHGSSSPLVLDDLGFKVAPGMLSAMGVR